jgi:hypothetical protein
VNGSGIRGLRLGVLVALAGLSAAGIVITSGGGVAAAAKSDYGRFTAKGSANETWKVAQCDSELQVHPPSLYLYGPGPADNRPTLFIGGKPGATIHFNKQQVHKHKYYLTFATGQREWDAGYYAEAPGHDIGGSGTLTMSTDGKSGTLTAHLVGTHFTRTKGKVKITVSWSCP